MGNIIVFNNVTLDGFIAGPNGELDWAIQDDEVAQYSKVEQNTTGTFLFGRVTYDMMASFWPTPVGKSTSPVFAEVLNNSTKIVFSSTLQKANWQHTEIIRAIHKDEILKLKQQSGKDMMIFGSGTIVEQLTNLGLIDEYQLIINPIILGKGKRMFDGIKDMMKLKLISTKTFSSGVVLLQYQP